MTSDPALLDIPPGGSLGVLAHGYRGVVAWRAARGVTWRDEMRRHARSESLPGPTHEADPEALAATSLVVVSGLPRTGTSMMMQMLTAGGLGAYTDGAREADDSNPRGYFEHARVRGLAKDRAWVPDADGLVVKVVAPLLPYLPAGPRYRVVLMDRPLSEVLASQTAMLARLGRDAVASDVLRAVYQRQIDAAHRWASATPGVTLHVVDYHHTVAAPMDTARALGDFIPSLDAQAMAAAVDPSLHRERSDAPTR